MNTQINIRVSPEFHNSMKTYSQKHGYGSVQDFIKETIREKLFEQPPVNKDEFQLVKKLFEISEKKSLYGTEKELFEKLRRK
ncbi:MAG: hypothetical protein ACMXYF_05860 [Candidatus Woesearchaeota archaeon]